MSLKKDCYAFCLLIAFIITIFLTAFSQNDVYADDQGDAFDVMREKWKDHLTGGSGFDSDDPDISAYIENLVSKVTNDEGTGYWDTMNQEDNRTYLWNDLASTSDPGAISDSYNRLKEMALAYSIKGSEIFQNEALKQDIVSGLDWLYLNRYNETKSQYGNWWHWEIGTPMALKDLLVLMYDDLTSKQIANYIKAIDRFVPDPVHRVRFPGVIETGANRMDKALIVSVRGIVAKDSDKVAEARDALSQVFEYVTDGDGFYRDGSFVQHGYVPYNGSYGIVLMDHLVDVLYILAGSSFEVTDPNLQNVYQWVFDSYEPLIYKGAMMDMVRGRAISRENSSDHSAGRSVIIPILKLAKAAPADAKMRIESMVKYWIESDTTFDNYVSGLNISEMISVKSLLNDSTVSSRGELVKHQVFASMDRVIHRRPGFGFGISMSSNRIANFEYVNQENKKGWYTGYGMTYLYNNDLAQFSEDYWPTVDMFRLPGTTTDGIQGTLKNDYYYRSSKSWVGGSSVDGLYGATGMEFDPENSTLTGKKSWFSFDDEIVALGAGITGNDDREVETIVENRKLNENGDNVLTVNGEEKPSKTGWVEDMEKVEWAHLKGNVPGSDIGYYFPGTANVNGLRESRTGSWNQVGTGSSNKMTRNYLSLAFNHNVNPENASYSYVLLPNKSDYETKQYSRNSDIEIIKNTSDIQAVKEKELGLSAINFWEAGEAGFIRSLQPASVMVKEDGDVLTLSVSDPTQKQDRVMVELGKIGSSVISKDDSVTVLQTEPYIQLAIDVKHSLGKSHTIKFNKSNGGELPPTGKLEMDGVKEIHRGEQTTLKVKVTNNGERVLPEGKLSLSIPEDLMADPKNVAVRELQPNESDTVTIEITVPEDANYGHHEIEATFKAGDTMRRASYSVKVIPPIGPPQNAREYKIESVEASAVPQAENSPKNTIDGDLNTRWSAQGEQWIKYDLGGVKEVKHVSIAFHNGDARSGLFDIQTSIDGENWTAVFSGESSGTTKKLETYTFDTFQAKYIRILGHGNTGSDWNSITEVNIYGNSLNSAADMKKVVERFKESGEFANDEVTRILQTHLTAVAHFEGKGSQEKVVKHLKGFKVLLANQKENKLISEMAYSILKADTDYLIDKWQ